MSFPTIFRARPARDVAVRTGAPFAPWREFDQLFDDLWRGSAVTGPIAAFQPQVDVVESESEFRVVAELPGLEEKDFQVDVHGDVLTLRGEKRAEHEEDEGGWHRSERTYGSFQRSFRIPSEVDGDAVAASFKNGVLTVTLPKTEAAKPREIPVTAS